MNSHHQKHNAARSLPLVLVGISLLFLVVVGFTPLTWAQPFTPKSGDYIVAKWQVKPTQQKSSASLDYIEWLIDQGQYAGKSAYNFGRANALLAPHLTKPSVAPQAWYLSARILQHQHQFKPALTALDNVLSLAPEMLNARLLKANIHLVLSEYSLARQTCLTLLGQADMLTIAACSLEVESYQGKLLASYQQLAQLLVRYPLPEDETGVWLLQLVADMAYRQGEFQSALNWLNKYPKVNKPLSFIVQWADIHLALNQAEPVLAELTDIVNGAEFKDDALLLRLALAEKQLTGQNFWAQQMAERVNLRVQRQDQFHAAELARYYLEINPDPVKALYWADINWQSAKLAADKYLLDQATLMQVQQADTTSLQPVGLTLSDE
ncbi:MAG: tetratricopeptide repeat protein [Thalassotalea sp.]